ncbi:hypothetical protein [Leptolyngbya sp. FACHB-16]|uniref:hypothetical protein n=1 Tax=unclassified Leptolyngbya TaxID=2650499 RepID=UPI001688246A|nr:hypothetical protein [Leptolyngbya sp. FACHB-16]MBD2156036.1 hypothetical protein [Leptolyngbya sp. FACHB-16]
MISTRTAITPDGQQIHCKLTSFADLLKQAKVQEGLPPARLTALKATEHLQEQPDPDEQIAELLERERLELVAAQEGDETRQSERDRLIAKRNLRFHQFWGHLRKDFDINAYPVQEFDGFVPSEALDGDHRTIAIRGGLGSGKTQAILDYLNRKGIWAVWGSARNLLLRDTQARAILLGLLVQHFQDDVQLGRDMLRDGLEASLFMAFASFSEYHFMGVDWSDKTVVIDEFQSVRKEIIRCPRYLKEFTRMIRTCKRLIIADAFLSDACLRWILGIRGDGGLLVLKQRHTPDPTPVKWIECLNKKGEISLTHEGAYLPLLRQWRAEGLSVAIASDSATTVQVLFDAGDDGSEWLTWSKSIVENHQLFADLNGNLEGVQLWAYTPTVESGADCQKFFDRVLVIANGVIAPTAMIQMSKRVRNAGEIWVSAPRKTADPSSVTAKLDGIAIGNLALKVARLLTNPANDPDLATQEAGAWERAVSEVQRVFNSEYVYALLSDYFANVETVTIGQGMQNTGEWRSRREALKNADAERLLTADLDKGHELRTQEKEPRTEAEAWALDAAHLDHKYHKIFRSLRAAYAEQPVMDAEVIKITRQLMSSKLDKLKQWRIAEQSNSIDDERLGYSLSKGIQTYAAPGVVQKQMITLYRRLQLRRLAKLGDSAAIVNETVFDAKSPEIENRWYQFRRDPELTALFPEIQTQAQLWEAIKKCMGFMGHGKEAARLRVETDSVVVNGYDRKGNRRYSQSKITYLVGWKPVTVSGGKVYREIFPELIACIDDLLERERNEYLRQKQRREELLKPPVWPLSHTPPGAGGLTA